jgi:hypothetical protein
MTNTILDGQSQLVELEKSHDSLLIEQKYTLTNTEINIVTLESKLALAKSELLYAENDTSTTTISPIEQEMTDAFTLVESIYDQLYTNIELINNTLSLENKNNSQYWAIGNNNPTLKTQIDDLYTQVKQDRVDLIPVFAELKNKSNSLSDVLIALDTMKKIV